MDKPTIPRGTRDFGPSVMVKRNFIIDTIKGVFERYGFLPLETPAMENLSVLTGKYGEEGDQLLFKILNSGNYLDGIDRTDLSEADSKSLAFRISEKGLRYDLTVPFARYVVMNRNDIVFPFKRYQVQPVWRADRPQKGRYREFYQCDADVVGTDSLICEAEIILMIHEVFSRLGIREFSLRINSRKILEGMAEAFGVSDRTGEFFTLLDKLDKTGKEKLLEEFSSAGFNQGFIQKLDDLLSNAGRYSSDPDLLTSLIGSSDKGLKGIEEIKSASSYCRAMGADLSRLEFDFTLARGLSYYTGIILEARITNVKIGSVGGGGRYDNLTGVFGLPGISGVGFSFGIDRIFDVMDELTLFPEMHAGSTRIMLTNFGGEAESFALGLITRLRQNGINAEIFPENDKIKKQLNFANKKRIPYVLFIGTEELKQGRFALKNMLEGTQEELTVQEVIKKLHKD
jgi:histidyl-tRNA synthetase